MLQFVKKEAEKIHRVRMQAFTVWMTKNQDIKLNSTKILSSLRTYITNYSNGQIFFNFAHTKLIMSLVD